LPQDDEEAAGRGISPHKTEAIKRPSFKGTIQTLYKVTNKSAYIQDGSQMFKVNREVTETEDKVSTSRTIYV
jgi:hypothetical protein